MTIMSSKEKQGYEKELKQILEAICDGFRQEVRIRQQMVRKFPSEEKDNFPLIFEKERGIANILAFYIRKAGFFVRAENWFCDEDEELKNKTPDLDIWLCNTAADFFLEIKPIKSKNSQKVAEKIIRYDLEKLLKAKNPSNYYSGILIFGFIENNELQEELRNIYENVSKYIEGYKENSFRKLGKIETISFKDTKLKSVIVGLWYRKNGLMN
jgi:hypothetical protein